MVFNVKIFEKANLWSQNDEKDGVWYTFALINQGQWQEQRCRECPNLTSLLHQLDSLITDCVFFKFKYLINFR